MPPTLRRRRPAAEAQPALASAVAELAERDAHYTSTIPSGYGGRGGGLTPWAVVGVTLGAVVGFLLLCWLVYVGCNAGVLGGGGGAGSVATESGRWRDQDRRSRSRSRAHRRRHRAHREEGGGRARPFVVEEPRAGGRARAASAGGDIVVEEEDVVDEVVVIEESPPKRHRSRRRGSPGRESGYRDVYPERFAGGRAPMREVRRPSRG